MTRLLPGPTHLLLFALAVAVLALSACDVLAVPDDPGDEPPPPPQTFDDTPVARQSRVLATPTTVFTLFNTGLHGASTGDTGGDAFAYLGADGLFTNGLYEGQLLIGASETQVSGQPYTAQPDVGTPNWTEGSALAAVRDVGDFGAGVRTRYTDAGVGNPNPIGLTVTQWAYTDGALDGAVVLVFDVRNDGPARDALYVGLFADFDVDAPATDASGYDAATRTLYTYDTAGSTPHHYGLSALSHATSGWSTTIDGLASGTTDADLFTALTTTGTIPSEPGDRRSILGVGPFRLASGATQRVAFAYVAGRDRAELLAHATDARTAYASLPVAP